jgi:hypothetical protein
MPFIRLSRDRRGYEHLYLLHTDPRRGHGRAALLYWARSPADLRVGREPLDRSTRARLERAHPALIFDWTSLARTVAAGRAQQDTTTGPAGGAQPSSQRRRRPPGRTGA